MTEFWDGPLSIGLPFGILIGALGGKWVMLAAQRVRDREAARWAVQAQQAVMRANRGWRAP